MNGVPRHWSVFNNVSAGWLPCSLLKELYGGQRWRGGGVFPQKTDPGGRGALRQATAQQLLCAQWPLLFSPHRRWWQQQQVPIGWSPSHHCQKSHLVRALCPLSATNIHNAMTTATRSKEIEFLKFWLKHMRTGFNADCIVLHLYLFRVKNVSKQFLPREAVCVSFVLKSVFFRAVL